VGTRPRPGTTWAGTTPAGGTGGCTAASPRNRFGESLFRVSAGAALGWARRCPDADVVAVFPRYHPWWASWVVAVPGLREIVSWNLVIVLRRR
jgi:hypothetical protein